MRRADQQHAETALADAAAHRQRQLARKQHPVEGERAAVIAAGDGQLRVERLGIDADAHGGDLEGVTEDVIPVEDIAVEFPVVIVGRAAIVLDAGLQHLADLHHEDDALLLADLVFALLGRQVGVEILQLLRGDKEDLAAKLGTQGGEGDVQRVARLADGADDVAHGALEIVNVAVLGGDDLLPVPLVHVDGVEVIDLFVAADGVHIGKQTLADVELIALERETLPLGQRLHHLRIRTNVGNVKSDRTLHAVQVVVQTGVFLHEQRGGDPAQIQCIAQIDLEVTLDEFDGALHFINRQRGMIALRDIGSAHAGFTPLKKYALIIITYINDFNSEILRKTTCKTVFFWQHEQRTRSEERFSPLQSCRVRGKLYPELSCEEEENCWYENFIYGGGHPCAR